MVREMSESNGNAPAVGQFDWRAEREREYRREQETLPDTDPPPAVSHVAVDPKARKATPIYSGVIRYFPDALVAVAEVSRIGNEQHHPGEPLHWDRLKSTDELDALARHLVDAGKFDSDGARHSAKVAWRALANLQKEIEGSR